MSLSIWNEWQEFCLSALEKIYPSVKKQYCLPNNSQPDFFIPENQLIIDAKLTAKTTGISESIDNYSAYCNRLEFWCLYGKKIEHRNKKVSFVYPLEILTRLENNNVHLQPFIFELKKLRQRRFPPRKYRIASIFWDSDQPLKRFLKKGLEYAWDARTKSGEKRLLLGKDWYEQLLRWSSDIVELDMKHWVRTNLQQMENSRLTIKFDFYGTKTGREALGIEVKSRIFATDMINRKKVNPYRKDFVKYHFASPLDAWEALYRIEKAHIGVSGHEEFGQALEFWKYYQSLVTLLREERIKKAYLGVLIPFYAEKKMVNWIIWSLTNLLEFELKEGAPSIPITVWQFQIQPTLRSTSFIPETIEFQEVWKNTEIRIPTPHTVNVPEILVKEGYGGVKGCTECSYLSKFCLKPP